MVYFEFRRGGVGGAHLILQCNYILQFKYFFMLAKADWGKVYETVLSTLGMNDTVKIGLIIPRKNVLILSKIIERGLSAKSTDDKLHNVLEMISEDNFQDLLLIASELLERQVLL